MLWQHFIIQKNHWRENSTLWRHNKRPPWSSTPTEQANTWGDVQPKSQQTQHCIINTHFNTMYTVLFLNQDCRIQNILEQTVRNGSSSDLELAYKVRHLAASWHFLRRMGVFLLHCFMTHHISKLLSSSALILPSCAPCPARLFCSIPGKTCCLGG